MKKNETKKQNAAKCAYCGHEFSPARKTQKYCSDACYRAEKAKRDKKRVRKAEAKKPTKDSLRLKEKIVLPKSKAQPKHECAKKRPCKGKNRIVAVIVITKCDKPTGKRK